MVLKGNIDELLAVKNDKEASVLKVWFASVASKAISKGDIAPLSILLDRIAGKVKEHIKHEGIPSNVATSHVVILPEKEIHADKTTAGTTNKISDKSG